VVGHRYYAGLKAGAWSRYRLLQVGGEGGDPAMAGKRIADEGETAEGRHVCAPTIPFDLIERATPCSMAIACPHP